MTARPLPQTGEVPPRGWDPLHARSEFPEGAVRCSLEEFTLWRERLWSWAARELEDRGAKEPLRRFAENRAAKVGSCGTAWLIPRCEHGHEHGKKAHLTNSCGDPACPMCARREAGAWRKAGFHYAETHPVNRVKGEVSRDYYLLTMGPKPSGGDSFSAKTVLADYDRAMSGARNVWRKVLQFLPDEGGKCEDAGFIVRVEIGPRGKVHVHCLFYGAYHRVEPIREAFLEKVPSCQWLKVEHVKAGRDGGGLRGAVAEVLKYFAKGSVAAGVSPEYKGEYVHPLVTVISELALYRRKRTVAYGTMKGMKRAADQAVAEQEREDAAAKVGDQLEEPCPKCGSPLVLRLERREKPWVPKGWCPMRPRPDPEWSDDGETITWQLPPAGS